MFSIIKAATFLTQRVRNVPSSLFVKPAQTRLAHNFPNTYDFARERILLTLRLFDKIDPQKLTLESHFYHDLGLDSLDHVEIIMKMEHEFNYEIPDRDAENLLTPGALLQYITDKDEAYEERQRLEIADHHNHHHHDHDDNHHHHHHMEKHGEGAGLNTVHKQHFSTSSAVFKKKGPFFQDETWETDMTELPNPFSKPGLKTVTIAEEDRRTSFYAKHKATLDHDAITERVLKVCNCYDKIDSSKFKIDSHFFEDLGLDSLDHVEIMMELEDEFAIEIPDEKADKLFRPIDVVKYIIELEHSKQVKVPEDRKF